MRKYKDTGKVNKDLKFKAIKGDIIIKEGSQVVIEKWINKRDLQVTDTNPNSIERKYFTVNKNDVAIDYSDITKDIIIPLLIDEGWKERDLIKEI